ncbi:MFS transporter [Escherichia coli]
MKKVSRRSNFEFGRARMFGCVGWALCASIVGIMFTINNQFVFWLGSGWRTDPRRFTLFRQNGCALSPRLPMR